ncbi:hypothetical protein [Dyadobacter chenhuakuii]|uniref:KTSC domain-containing protein n=1 Tax=Dyadobacter chenhuakuii TaxID=2909339 RepID=A0A9X1QHI0_9BACT|nr:hypothetical protein [Dyadobacter chenhuakuii]MCF2501691.1 hypothetical protein [Dyadobacter chenhuakuii]
MKNFLYSFSLLLLINLTVTAQTPKCQELLEFVVENGSYEGEVSGLALFDSSWLKSVKAYQYKNSVFMVYEISTDNYGFSSKPYIFCGIPIRNWANFSKGLVDFHLGYAKKFHKYIID